MKSIKFILALHNHQPVGNFDVVFEETYEKSYKPFLDLLNNFPGISVSLHYSGALMEWLIRNKPEFVTLLRKLTDRNNLELISGAYYEPMLTLLPERDRLGQIKLQNAQLRDIFGFTPQGMWLPERVWSADIPATVYDAGLKYTMIDEHHISSKRPVKGYYNSENEGRTCGVFAISGDLREMFLHKTPQNLIDFLLSHTSENDQDVLVHMDNGEKFGAFPQSDANLEWLRQFFELLQINKTSIKTTTFMEYWKHYMPLGLRYPTEGAYPEMDEWAQSGNGFGKGWRSFLIKYPEANWMHKRMSQISQKIETLEHSGKSPRSLSRIRRQFWSGTTHDAYWHGIYGGIYLPHLRNVTWAKLIEAENAVDQRLYNLCGQICQELSDINRDGYNDITITTKNLRAVFDSRIMGGLEELDYKPASVNLCNTIACHPEDFHHDMDIRPLYDKTPRYSLIERYYDVDIDIDLVRDHTLQEASDFLNEAVEVKNTVHTHCVKFSRNGWINWQRAYLCKTISFKENGFDIHYKIRNNGISPIRFSFGPEFNFSVTGGPWEKRFYAEPDILEGKTLEYVSDTEGINSLIIQNAAEHYQIRITNPEAARVMTYPHIIPVLSPGGVENIFQNVVLNYFWKLHIQPRSEKNIRLSVDILPL